jgi:hypothetical protein
LPVDEGTSADQHRTLACHASDANELLISDIGIQLWDIPSSAYTSVTILGAAIAPAAELSAGQTWHLALVSECVYSLDALAPIRIARRYSDAIAAEFKPRRAACPSFYFTTSSSRVIVRLSLHCAGTPSSWEDDGKVAELCNATTRLGTKSSCCCMRACIVTMVGDGDWP